MVFPFVATNSLLETMILLFLTTTKKKPQQISRIPCNTKVLQNIIPEGLLIGRCLFTTQIITIPFENNILPWQAIEGVGF